MRIAGSDGVRGSLDAVGELLRTLHALRPGGLASRRWGRGSRAVTVRCGIAADGTAAGLKA